MLGLPERTEFNKRIPKQKFYENIDIPHTLKRVFVDQIRIIYWRNKLAATTMNITAGEEVTEIEVLEIRLQNRSLMRPSYVKLTKKFLTIFFSFSPMKGKNRLG